MNSKLNLAKILVKNLVKKFGDLTAVNGISFEVEDGEFLCLLGPSGAGKTTTLRCIAGLENPDEGEIYVGGELINALPPSRRDMAMVFQSYALYPHYTVYKNVAHPLLVQSKKLSKSEIDGLVQKATAMVHIEHLLDRKPQQLSGGERQRVAIARALVRRPKLFIMDEPLTNLDAKLRTEMRSELKKLQKDIGTTTIYATPDQSEALTMADRTVVMDKGRAAQMDDGKGLYEKPKNRYVAGFIGSPPMNFIYCTVRESEGKVFLESEGFTYSVAGLTPAIEEYSTGQELVLGIRPEHITLSKEKLSSDSIQTEVFAFELSRPESIVAVKVSSHVLNVKTPSDITYGVGENVWMTFDRNKIHVFDKKSDESLN